MFTAGIILAIVGPMLIQEVFRRLPWPGEVELVQQGGRSQVKPTA